MECGQWATAPSHLACHVPNRVSIVSFGRGDSALGGKRTLLAIWLIFPCKFHRHTTPITRRKLCSRVERRARRLAAGARAPVQTREKLVRQDSSLMMMKDDVELPGVSR